MNNYERLINEQIKAKGLSEKKHHSKIGIGKFKIFVFQIQIFESDQKNYDCHKVGRPSAKVIKRDTPHQLEHKMNALAQSHLTFFKRKPRTPQGILAKL